MLRLYRTKVNFANISDLQRQEMLLGIKSLAKRIQLVAPVTGLLCAGARDNPTITGNVKRGVVPVARVSLTTSESAVRALASRLESDASLEELVQLREQLLAHHS